MSVGVTRRSLNKSEKWHTRAFQYDIRFLAFGLSTNQIAKAVYRSLKLRISTSSTLNHQDTINVPRVIYRDRQMSYPKNFSKIVLRYHKMVNTKIIIMEHALKTTMKPSICIRGPDLQLRQHLLALL